MSKLRKLLTGTAVLASALPLIYVKTAAAQTEPQKKTYFCLVTDDGSTPDHKRIYASDAFAAEENNYETVFFDFVASHYEVGRLNPASCYGGHESLSEGRIARDRASANLRAQLPGYSVVMTGWAN